MTGIGAVERGALVTVGVSAGAGAGGRAQFHDQPAGLVSLRGSGYHLAVRSSTTRVMPGCVSATRMRLTSLSSRVPG